MPLTIPVNKQLPLSVAYVDFKGNPAQVHGAPVWTSSDETTFVVVAAPDGMSAVVKPVGPVGTAQIKASADADLGDGVKNIDVLDVAVAVAGEAVSGTFNPGELEDLT